MKTERPEREKRMTITNQIGASDFGTWGRYNEIPLDEMTADHTGLTDLTVLIGYFASVSLSLMAYDVPSGAIGLQR
jgi:hypothetical protein